MPGKNLAIILLTVLLVLSLSFSSGALETNDLSAILLDAETGQVLYANNTDEELPPASITKIMTVLLTMEAIENGELELTDSTTISSGASSMGGSQIFLNTGDEITIEELLMAVIISSANDASYALAEAVGGHYDYFVEMMNDRARELGMENTNFTNPHGLPDSDHYSTARDISKMAREVVQYQEVLNWSQIWLEYLELPDRQAMLTNTNRMILNYSGMDGLKTGYTRIAGFCLAATARQGDFRLISVVLGADSRQQREELTARMLDYGFENYRQEILLARDDEIEGILVPESETEYVSIRPDRDLKAVVPRYEEYAVDTEMKIQSELELPISAGTILGEAVAMVDGEEVHRSNLLAAHDIERAGFFTRLLRRLRSLLGR